MKKGAWANIPPKSNRSDPICFSYLYRARNQVERFFNRIKRCRRVATRYDRLAANFYLVLEQFKSGTAFRETDEDVTYIRLIDDLLTVQYGDVVRIVAFNPVEGWSRDASETVAEALESHITAERREVPEGLRDFIEGYTGRRIGQQLPLL